MKKFRFLLIIISMVLVFQVACIPTISSAADVFEEETEEQSAPEYVIYCEHPNAYMGKHDALSQGWGDVYLNGQLNFSGVAFQCTRCYYVIVTEHESPPHLWAWPYPGKYAMWDAQESITGISVTLFTGVVLSNYSNWDIPGFDFRYPKP